ncbi:MAG: PAS domain S-box protein [Comamonadaceae bacterium]|nr:PAS domain S-box protein [Comamonadaceae bacterium]
MLVWLAGRYEISQVQERLERDTADAVSDIRSALTRNVQALQSLYAGSPTPGSWSVDAASMLHEHREWSRLEWRDPGLALLAGVDSPFRAPVFDRMGRDNARADIAQACLTARKYNGPAYSASYFVPQSDGLGMEVMEMCMPLVTAGRLSGYVVATYSLQGILSEMIGQAYTRSQEVSFTEADGTRLALHGSVRRGNRVFTAQQLLDLPGNTLVLRMDGWRSAPDLFPNVLTALVTAMSIALVSVLVLLRNDMRRRQKAERDLADALAFRKAMEDSLVTGLRARDLQGRTTYVNPAFCEMVGFSAGELLGRGSPAPYWPPELADEYQQRQAIRLEHNHAPAREGFESVFMRKDGRRFPVLIIEAPLINVLGRQTGWMSALLDISEQRRVEELQRASQERLQATARLATVGEMASLLSHELNQPLAAIASYATGSLNLLQDTAPGLEPGLAKGSDLQLALRRIAEQAERAGKVIRSVHDFVRRRDQLREAVSPNALLNDIMPLVNLQARKLQVRVRVEVDDGLPDVLCDRIMVEQVLLNLARNAMQAMDLPDLRDRPLEFRVRRAASAEGNRWLEFSVADGGAGIPGDVARQLFTPFFTTKTEGMGLGLSLCRTVVEQHGGYLDFVPNTPSGTVFRFTLPAVANRKAKVPSIE